MGIIMLTMFATEEFVERALEAMPACVQEHLAALSRRLGVANRTQAAIYALSQGLATPPR